MDDVVVGLEVGLAVGLEGGLEGGRGGDGRAKHASDS